jgi:hypothetical protein
MAGTCYLVLITGSNELGEGYKTKKSGLVVTMQSDRMGKLYVWGDNSAS